MLQGAWGPHPPPRPCPHLDLRTWLPTLPPATLQGRLPRKGPRWALVPVPPSLAKPHHTCSSQVPIPCLRSGMALSFPPQCPHLWVSPRRPTSRGAHSLQHPCLTCPTPAHSPGFCCACTRERVPANPGREGSPVCRQGPRGMGPVTPSLASPQASDGIGAGRERAA